MLTLSALMASPAFFVALVVVLVGALVFWSNPSRSVNRLVFSCSVHVAAWLVVLNLARNSPTNGLFWLRCTYAVSASVPFHFWLVKEGILEGFPGIMRSPYRLAGWLAVSVALTWVCFTEYFIPSASLPGARVRGWGFHAYEFAIPALYAWIFIDSMRKAKSVSGSRQLELQVWTGGGCAMAASILGIGVVSRLTRNPDIITLYTVVVAAFYLGTVIAITNHRIFDARQILLVAIEKIVLVVSVALFAYLLHSFLAARLPVVVTWILIMGACLWVAVVVNTALDRLFQFYPQATSARQAAHAAARVETRVDALEHAFLSILKGWGGTEQALLLSGTKSELRNAGEVQPDEEIQPLMRELKWVTPERLAREGSTPEREALARFLARHHLGVLVFGEGPTLTVLVGVGIPVSRRPFTYPQVQQLLELTAIIENSLERTHYLVKSQHAERLATVGLLGASIAHEIRNPLVSIKTFVQLLPERYQDPAFRDKFFKLIGDEVSRIDQLTEQLLDMAAPRVYSATPLHLHPLLRAGLDLVAAKADDRGIRIVSQFEACPDVALTDPTATKQVLLNLCFNAIHAVENREGERWVRIVTRNVANGIEMAVTDNGPGIAPEIAPKLFQPFQTTKSSGFGLGLAICGDILSGLKATIAADAPRPGEGATFRVHFPCPPLSS